MKIDLLNYLKCPETHEELVLGEVEFEAGLEIISGKLISTQSKNEYKIIDEIPNLIVEYIEKVKLTSEQFSFQHLKVGEHLHEKSNSIDFVYSIGVLHYTPNPTSAFSNLASTITGNEHS